MIGLDIVAALESAGVSVVGPIGSAKDALRSLEGASFDGVLLEANLRGEPAGDVAVALTRRKIPFVFVIGLARRLWRAFSILRCPPFELKRADEVERKWRRTGL